MGRLRGLRPELDYLTVEADSVSSAGDKPLRESMRIEFAP